MVRREVQGRENRVLSVVEAPGVVLHGVWLSVPAHVVRVHKSHLLRVEHDEVLRVFVGLGYLLGVADSLVKLRLQRGTRTARSPDRPHVRIVAETTREAHGNDLGHEVGEQLSVHFSLLVDIGIESHYHDVLREALLHRLVHCSHYRGGEHAVCVSMEGDEEVLPAVPGALYSYGQQVAVRELDCRRHEGGNHGRHLLDAMGLESVLLEHNQRVLVALAIELHW
mmetsp:Transcript_119905/g.255886  ORF Transcript_119905/g.255886 Transcript_119905/m.255886 type:complete len:224 (-) Transcript_119905:1127-1798(-)